MVHLAAVQQERWIHFVESTDLTQNSRKGWHNIRQISNDPTKPNSKYEVTANQVAHVLIKNGKTQVMKKPGMWKRLFFKRFRFHTYRFRFH